MFFALPHDIRRALFAQLHPARFQLLQEKRSANSESSFSLFDKHECIFIHIPKTGGSSVAISLFGKMKLGHNTITKHLIVYSHTDFDRYFKFCFVRNPWDRLFSAYNYLKNGGEARNENDLKFWNKHKLEELKSFNNFVRTWVNKDNIYAHVHFIPQYKFICHPTTQNILVDYIGRYETINENYIHIRRKLGLQNGSLEYRNKSRNKELFNYREMYSKKSIDIVKNVYRYDIELFSYSFE